MNERYIIRTNQGHRKGARYALTEEGEQYIREKFNSTTVRKMAQVFGISMEMTQKIAKDIGLNKNNKRGIWRQRPRVNRIYTPI